ncbi:hypothetical protein CBP51_00530 [Cellvibrio mixtus]|uniref:Insecticide toxin TcdB middle/N-terminal domain-containing protein n=1 Tax=Cellvibrio mixtus TaxID=39650 RepID=A0A266Q6R4_9GAMM|nr:FG-GAP-like repeat-containing protein [Cellvibrio mixtus]OZY85574.1 hypothetical protein CBP51_00530 [Cellvibrio mixtus]
MLSSAIKSFVFFASLFLFASGAAGAEINKNSYDIYLGDLDGDGDDDFYFQQKAWYLILHGDIPTPIKMVSNNFAIHNNGGTYSAPVAFSLTDVDLLARVSSGTLKLGVWNTDIFLVAQANGGNTLLVRGAYNSSPGLLLKSYSSSALPSVAATYPTSTYRGISDRSVLLRIVDANGDGINDIVLGRFGSVDGEYAYLGNSNDVHSELMVISRGIPSSGNGALVGAVAGSFRVNESGAATYSIPIATPKGVANVTPQVSIGYSSDSGQGLVGYGANVSGLGSISRCRQTLLQDDVAKPITWTDQDRFCLNGQRLMLISSGSYGAVGSIYKTEIDSFIRVEAIGGIAGNPDYFEVQSKDGSKTFYGNTPEAKLIFSGKTLTWAQSRFEDSVGNRIDYVYEGGSTDGHRIKTISYAFPNAKSSSGSVARIEFSYLDRSDSAAAYISGGFLLKGTKRLSSVTSYEGGNIFRKYNFNYNETAYSTVDNLSRLTSVEECMSGASSNCYPKTHFTWGQKSVGFDTNPIWMNQLPSASKFKTYRFMDFNADGRQDFVWVRGSGVNRYIEYGAINRYASGGIQKQRFSGNLDNLAYTIAKDNSKAELRIEAIDYNNDGRQDLAVCKPINEYGIYCTWELYLSVSNSVGGWTLSSNKITLPFTRTDLLFGDINSDGLVDAIEQGSSNVLNVYLGKKVPGVTPDSNQYYAFSSEPIAISMVGTPAVPQTVFPETAPSPDKRNRTFDYKKAMLGDIDGDGRVDLMVPAITVTPPCTSYKVCHSGSGGYSSNSQVMELFTYLNKGNEFVYSSAYKSSLASDQLNNSANILPTVSFKPVDFNGDGLIDIASMDGINWRYFLNTGNGFSFKGDLTGFGSSSESTSSIEIFDYNRDGYLDALWHDKNNKQLKLRKWDATTNKMEATDTVLYSSRPAGHNYSVGDMTGDGFADLIELKTDSNNNIDIGIFSGLGNANSLDKVYKITDGLGKVVQINYGSLANSAHYTTLSGVNNNTTTDSSFCSTWNYPAPCVPPQVYSLNVPDFYTQLNRPFGAAFESKNPAPLLEVAGPIYVVTQVSGSAPTASSLTNLSKITYHYHHARMQAGGRGYLGFEKISTIDQQSKVKTETSYHQDWPYIGMPKSTVVKTKEGFKLSEASNTWIESVDSNNSRIYRISLDKVTETSYELKNNGAEQGNSLQVVTTDTDYDAYGNVTKLEVVTSGQANTSTQTTENTYYPTEWEQRMGRLDTSTVTTKRNTDIAVVRKSKFEYYGENDSWPGMLKKEIIEPGSNQLVTEYQYDSVGNKTITLKTANVKPNTPQTRKSEIIYDSSNRFAKTVLDSVGNTVSGVTEYHPIYGVPIELRDANGVITFVELNPDGTEKLRRNATGGGVHTKREFCIPLVSGVPGVPNGAINCPTFARYKAISIANGGGITTEYYDVLGRVVRTSQVMFDGRESHVDTEYDELGRITRKSEPYFAGDPVYWTVFAYDLVGRVTSVTAPDSVITTYNYSGYVTTTIADAGVAGKKLSRTEERNSLGNLVKVIDHLGGTIEYGYDPLGNLTSAKTAADGKTVVVKMCYDKLGRKIAMHDPDKGGFLGNASQSCSTIENELTKPASSKLAGWWFYQYNDFGELIEQTDTKRQVSTMNYDSLGRMINRIDRNANNTIDTHTRWYYDKPIGETGSSLNTQMKLTGVVTSYGGISEACGGANYCQTYSYDWASRLTDTVTYLPNESTGYMNSVHYDLTGRVYKQFDALNGLVQTSGTQTLFNSYGYPEQIKDIATGDVLQKTTKINARGQIKEELRNNGGAGTVTYVYDDRNGRLTNKTAGLAGALFQIQNVTYEWDSVGNLRSRWNQSGNVASAGSTAKKDLRESFCYDNLNRLIKSHGGSLVGSCALAAVDQDQEYDGLGNITRKVGVGVYSYIGKGPHAVSSTTATGNYGYDNNGNQVSGGGRSSIIYSSYDQPLHIVSASATTDFKYGPDRARFERKDTKGGQVTTTHYLGNVERIQVAGSPVVEWKRYVAGAVYTVRTINGSVEKTNKSFMFNDHLGSLDVVTDHLGKITHSANFDAWGARRNGENWLTAFALGSISLTGLDQPLTRRGYTGHEMLDDHGLIHMNGRIYDQKLARFMQADPFIQAALNTQSFNRYSYLFNNPLNATDPSGYFLMELDKKLSRSLFRSIGYENSQILISVGSIFCGPAAAACAAGATYSLNRAYGASSSDAFKAAVITGVSAAAFSSISNSGLSPTEAFFVSGFLGGVLAELQGGNFGHGFISAGVGASIGAKYGTSWQGMAASAVVGGTISEATGGKFANGAASAAFSYAAMWGASKIRLGGVKTNYEDGSASETASYDYVPEEDRQAYLEKSLSEFKAWARDSDMPLDNRIRAEKLTVTYAPEFNGSAKIEYSGKDFGRITVGSRWFSTTRGPRLELNAVDAKYVASLDSKAYDRFRWTHELAHLDPTAIQSMRPYETLQKIVPANWHDRSFEQEASRRAVNWMRGN